MNTPLFRLYLHGQFSLFCEDNVLAQFRGDKARALLAYLALQRGQPVPRQHLTALLWDGYPPVSAKTSLRVALSNLRQLLAPWDLLKSDHHTVQLQIAPDRLWCDTLVLEQLLAPEHSQPMAERWAEIQQLHQGELLAGFETIDSQPFRTWLYARRTMLRQQMAQIRAQVVAPVGIPTNLPRLLTPLFGRQAEIRALQQRITNPMYPLVTVVGQGGVGKTRLVLSVAQSLVDHLTACSDGKQEIAPLHSNDSLDHVELAQRFSDGIWFVALADMTPTGTVAEQLAAAIGATLHLSFLHTAPLATQLCDYLREKALLLILDNFEHLNAGVPFLLTLLQEAPQLTLLVTSRQPLQLQAEYVFTLRGLPIPNEQSVQPTAAAGNLSRRAQLPASMQLFYERVRRVVSNFRPNQHTYADIAAICRLVNGLPLAIELAAAQVRYRPCHEIRQALTTNYATLTTDLYDVPARHRSLWLVLDDSWRLLSPEEADVLTRCTLFHGGFTRHAAASIAEATPLILHRLEQKSFLHLDQAERYTMHPLVRQYTTKVFQSTDAEQIAAVAQRHSHYYLALGSAQETALQGAASPKATALIRLELLNIQAAWRWAIAHEQWHDLAACSTALATFYCMAVLVVEGSADFTVAVKAMQAKLAEVPGIIDQALAESYAQLLCAHAQLLLFLGEDQAVVAATQQVFDLMAPGYLPKLVAHAHLLWGKVLTRQGNPNGALTQFETALAIPEITPFTCIEVQFEIGDLALAAARYEDAAAWFGQALSASRIHENRVMEVLLLQRLAALHHGLADYDRVNHYGEAALQLSQQIDARHIHDNLLGNLGIIWALRGDYAMAQQYFKRALAAHRQSGQRVLQAHVLSNLGAAASRVGDYAAAFAYAQKSLQMMQQLGNVEKQPSTLSNLALFANHQGDYQTALKYAQQGLQCSQQVQMREMEITTTTTIGDVLAGLGQWNEAVAAYTQAMELAHSLTLPHAAIQALNGLLQVIIAQGRPRADVMTYVEEILAFHAQNSLMTLEEPFAVYLTCYQALVMYNDPRAEALLREAYQQLQSRAAIISDDAMRQSFLTQVAAHRTLVTVAQARLQERSDSSLYLSSPTGEEVGKTMVTHK